MATEKFYTRIKREGAAGAVRGKVSGTMAAFLGAEDEDVIEFECSGRKIVGGHVLSPKELARFERDNPVRGSAPAKKKVAKSKPAPKVAEKPAKKTHGKLAKPKKNRRTEVEYDEPKKKLKFGKLSKLKKK